MEQSTENVLGIQFDQQGINLLAQTGKWAKFIAIVGLIMCGILVLIGIFLGSMVGSAFLGKSMGAGTEIIFGVVYVVIALLYVFPCVFLYRFAKYMQAANNSHDAQQLNLALANLKSFFKFIGILIIIMLAFYLLAAIGGGIVGAMGRS
jgi:hypothetical protein